MKSEKGQALVEFILILPLLLLLLMGMIDIGGIIYQKLTLEQDLNTVVDLYQEKDTEELNRYLGEKKYTMDIQKIDNKVTLTLFYHKKITTPVLKNILRGNYKLETSRVFYEK